MITVALIYKYQDFFPGKVNLGTRVGIEPTHSHLRCDSYQLHYRALGSELVGRKGIQVVVLGAHYIRNSILLWNTSGGDHAVTVALS